MKRIASTSLALALGFSIAAVAFAQATQTSAGAGTTSSAAPAPAAATTPKPVVEVPVTVTVEYDQNNEPIGINCPSPDPVELSYSGGHVARWKLTTANADEITIKMADPGNPTSTAPFGANPGNPNGNKKEALSGAPGQNTVGKKYKYKISVRAKRPNGTFRTLILDPIIKITP
jgi:hypothetical protein